MQPTNPDEPQGQPPYGQQPPGQPPYGAGPGQPGGPASGQPPGATPHGGSPEQPSNGMGLTALILGIIAIPLVCCAYLGIPLGIVAVVLGWLGKGKAERGEATNRGQALAGLICGAIAVILGILLLLLLVIFNVVDWDLPTN